MPYRLTKGTISIIRQDAAGIKEAQDRGYSLDGECDNDGNITSTSVVIEQPAIAEQAPARTRGRKAAE